MLGPAVSILRDVATTDILSFVAVRKAVGKKVWRKGSDCGRTSVMYVNEEFLGLFERNPLKAY